MSASKAKKTYQYVMTADECQLVNLLRRLEADVDDLFPFHDDPRLKQKLDLNLSAGGRPIGKYEVDPARMIHELARVSFEILHHLLVEAPITETPSPLLQESLGEKAIDTGRRENIDGRDSFAVAQSDMDGDSTPPSSHQTLSWEAVRKELIPASIKDVVFLVADSALADSVEEDFKDLFPGVRLCNSLHVLASPEKEALSAQEQPRCVKTMTIDLDDAELTKDPKLEQLIREQYPWAMVTCKTDSGPSSEGDIKDMRQTSPHVTKMDPFEHLSSLAEFARESPAKEDFECFEPKAIEIWNELKPARKMDIAHARAIQAHYGKIVGGGGCAQCSESGFTCKAYAKEFCNIAVTQLGPACQNCRIKNLSCDLAPTVSRLTPDPTLGGDGTGLQADTRDPGLGLVRDCMLTPASNATTRYLASRASIGDADPHIEGDSGAGQGDHENHGPEVNPGTPSVITGSTKSASNSSAILSFAESIGVHVSPQDREMICSMYTRLQQNREVEPYVPRSTKLHHYYSNLVTLYILAYRQGKLDLAYIVLLRFQNTNYNKLEFLPDFTPAVNAFKHLPTDSPLCRWISTLYCYLWWTEDTGEYEKFAQDHPDLDPLALSKLLYAVTYNRDPFIEGHDAAVLTRWCNVHDHEEGSEDQRFCESMQVGLKLRRKEAVKKDEARMLAVAEERIRLYGGKELGSRTDSNGPTSTAKGKRKAESSAAGRNKKKNKRGGHSAGR